MPSTERVPDAVGALAAQLADAKPMRRGSVSERYMKCGQRGCRCQEDLDARHGPYYSLTRAEGGTTRSRYLTREQAAVARRHAETGQQFRTHLEAYGHACAQWADAQLDAPEAASPGAVQKGGATRRAPTRSSPRSPRS